MLEKIAEEMPFTLLCLGQLLQAIVIIRQQRQIDYLEKRQDLEEEFWDKLMTEVKKEKENGHNNE